MVAKLPPKEEKALDDPLGTAIKAFYNIEEIPANIEMSNPKVLITPQLFLCLIAKDKVTNEDLWTSRQMDGNYIMHLRAKYIEFWPRVFGENRQAVLRDQIISLFRLIAMCYIAFVPSTGVAGETAANGLLLQCDFAIRQAEELCLQVQESVIAQIKGSAQAKVFRQQILELDPKLFSLKAEGALNKVTRGKTAREDDTDDEPAGKRGGGGKSGGGGGSKKEGKGKRKCTRCKKNPFSYEEFKVHNQTCK